MEKKSTRDLGKEVLKEEKNTSLKTEIENEMEKQERLKGTKQKNIRKMRVYTSKKFFVWSNLKMCFKKRKNYKKQNGSTYALVRKAKLA